MQLPEFSYTVIAPITSLVHQGFLYAVGGYDGASRQCLSSVERYNPVSNEWQLVSDMTVKRSGAGVGVLGDYLYAVGGHDGPHVRKSVSHICCLIMVQY